ncbi:PP2C family protein-serine/threonine phosphatase [Streptomyces sp. NPDC006012]|uniref:PP2C family protein-serine/threonine phosphatase n=1 Tax=Streptomyces sp. NPDC006012 TaxID=3364739 RepID=UPI0036A756A3
MRLPGRAPRAGDSGRTGSGPAPWLRWLPAGYVALVVVLELFTPGQWPVSFVLVALPLLAAFAHSPAVVAGLTVFAVLLEWLLTDSPCCAGREVRYRWDQYYMTAYLCTALVGSLGTVLAAHRTRRERTLADVRFVADIAQQVLLKPVPHRIGDLRLESFYLSAAAEARIGGDLYEAVPTAHGVRLLVGDVRGKGLPAVESAAALLGAFREAAHDESGLPGLVSRVETSMTRRAEQLSASDMGERFVTAVFAEIRTDEHVVRVVNCGHPLPLLIRPGELHELDTGRSDPPLNLGMLVGEPYHVDVHPFLPGDLLLLYTDGVTETRDRDGAFYPLVERLRSWGPLPPRELLDRLHGDLLEYSRHQLRDDTAALAVVLLPHEEAAGASARAGA